MDNFDTLLDLLIKQKIKSKEFSQRLERLLLTSPAAASDMLRQLERSYQQSKIKQSYYLQIKQQIKEFIAEQDDDDSRTVIRGSGVSGGGSSGGDDGERTQTAVRGNEAAETKTTAEDSVASDTTDTQGPAAEPAAEADLSGDYGTGSIIKHRFELLEILGVGGMGKVYKAIDLLKAEAKDKRPHVAIKLLNDDFKDHPEAFISLQRESSRQQKLAHPNIATIYDFDRVGGPSTPVYITMEFMDGMELKEYIKKEVRPKGGLPFDEAYEIIKQLGAGLIYAHNLGLVHSDFKPGNAFYCKDGTVKTLDFGIARAVTNPVTGEAEKTLFDPGKLGALTPAYASLEMLQGEEPDPKDDIYALGCTCYELLTGKHPFNKLSADKAMANKLKPPYIKSLNKKQNRALQRSIAFTREDRSPSVGHFLEEVKGLATWHKNPITIAAAVLVIIGLMLIAPAREYLHQQELKQLIAEINNGDEATIRAKLAEVMVLDRAYQTTVTDGVKKVLQNYFSDKIAVLVDVSSDQYNFIAASEVIGEIRIFYPDSIFLQKQTSIVDRSRKQIIGELNEQYIAALKDPELIANTHTILNNIARIDPAHPLLDDPRPSNAYRLLALDKFNANLLDEALALVQSGLLIARDDPRLSDLETKVLRAQKVRQLETELAEQQTQIAVLDDYKLRETTIIELANLSPDSEIIAQIKVAFEPVLQKELDRVLKQGNRQDAELLVDDLGDLMSSLKLIPQLTQLRLAHLTGDARRQTIADLATTNATNIESALAAVQLDNEQWEILLLRNIEALAGLAKEDNNINDRLNKFRDQIADVYIAKADEVLTAERFDVADDYIDKALRFAPEFPRLVAMTTTINDAREEFDRIARVESNKSDFKTFVEADKVVEAEKLLTVLKADLDENDNYITFEAPKMLSESYARLAQSKADTKDYVSAFAFVTKGLEVDPNNISLSALKNEYQAEANILELNRLFETELSFPLDVRLKISQIENANPTRYAGFTRTAVKTLIDRINALRKDNEAAAAGLAKNAAALFPANPVLADLKAQLELQPWQQLGEANNAILAGKLTQATAIQQAAASQFTGHPDFVSFSQVLENKIKEANSIYQIFLTDKEAAGRDYEKLKVTKNLLDRTQQIWNDNPDYKQAERELNQLIAQVKPTPKPKIRVAEKSLDEMEVAVAAPSASGDSGEQQQAAAAWSPIASESECTLRLAGHGRRAKAVCFDMIHQSARGPLMVVVPTSAEVADPFAIAKYEISISDWSKYCILSGTCQPIRDKARRNEPLTGITLSQAQDYANWLSERTGKTYRLPTKAEWEYAASAGGKQPKKDFNCRVSIGEKLIKGTGIVSVKSGKSNGWGLKNYIGNVQEWVTDGNNVKVRGGAFNDAHSKCDISLERQHSGDGDNTTGFRILREDVG